MRISDRNRNLSGRFAIIIIALSILTSTAVPGVRHPDGLTGQMNGWAAFDYAKAVPEANVLIDDRCHFECGLNLPAFEMITVTGRIGMAFGDTLYYGPAAGVKIYFRDPTVRQNINPDGAVGQPVLSFEAGLNLSERDSRRNIFFARAEILMPTISTISLGLGGYFHDEDDPFRVLQYYGRVNFFPKKYDASSKYDNPDGAVGWPSFYLTGGGSGHGIFGQLDVAIPLNSGMTLVFYTRGERAPSPYVRIATLGAKFSFYPRQ